MTYLETNRIVKRVIAEVAGTLNTNGIRELDDVERGGVSDRNYVEQCIIMTAYNAVRAYPGFNTSVDDFCLAVRAVRS